MILLKRNLTAVVIIAAVLVSAVVWASRVQIDPNANIVVIDPATLPLSVTAGGVVTLVRKTGTIDALAGGTFTTTFADVIEVSYISIRFDATCTPSVQFEVTDSALGTAFDVELLKSTALGAADDSAVFLGPILLEATDEIRISASGASGACSGSARVEAKEL